MKKQPTYKISLTFALLLFAIPLIYVVFCKVNGYLILPKVVIFYFAISLITFGIASIFVFIKVIPGGVKVMFTSIILICTVGFCLFCQMMVGNTDFDVYRGLESINLYNESLPPEESRDFYKPYVETDNYGDFEDITYYYHCFTGLFGQMAETKIIKYDDVNFQKETDRISNELYFYEQSVDVLGADPVPIFSLDGFDFRLERRYDYMSYPAEMNFIGINEETNEIAYVEFYDYDLDPVWDFTELLNYNCGWSYIIKDRSK